VIVAWQEQATDRKGVFAQHFSTAFPVPVLPAFVSVQATQDRVVLLWAAAGDIGSSASVYRRALEGLWQPLGKVTADGSGQIRYEDRSVSPGERYAYRLGLGAADAEVFTAETWVDVPSGFTLALEGFKPNPAAGAFQITFTLADESPATLGLFSVSGRRVVTREVGSMGAGTHVLDLTPEGMRPGIYWIRVTQAGQAITKKGVVTE